MIVDFPTVHGTCFARVFAPGRLGAWAGLGVGWGLLLVLLPGLLLVLLPGLGWVLGLGGSWDCSPFSLRATHAALGVGLWTRERDRANKTTKQCVHVIPTGIVGPGWWPPYTVQKLGFRIHGGQPACGS